MAEHSQSILCFALPPALRDRHQALPIVFYHETFPDMPFEVTWEADGPGPSQVSLIWKGPAELQQHQVQMLLSFYAEAQLHLLPGWHLAPPRPPLEVAPNPVRPRRMKATRFG